MCNLQLAGIYTVTHTDTHRETHSANTAHAASVAWVHTTNAMHSQGRSFVWIVRQQQSVFMKPLLLDWCSLHIETLTKRVHVAKLPRSVCRYRIQKSASQIGTESNRRGSHSQRSSHLIRENSLTLKKSPTRPLSMLHNHRCTLRCTQTHTHIYDVTNVEINLLDYTFLAYSKSYFHVSIKNELFIVAFCTMECERDWLSVWRCSS